MQKKSMVQSFGRYIINKIKTKIFLATTFIVFGRFRFMIITLLTACSETLTESYVSLLLSFK